MRTLFAFLLACLPSAQARADVDLRLGAGPGCAPAGSNLQAAIDAADPALGVLNLHIARNASYSGQHLDINGRNVRLIGGYADCLQAQPDATRTVLSGAGGGSDSVITIRGATHVVALRNLDITGGDEVATTSGYGGGIDVRGGPHALVYLENVRLHGNEAGYGGGISVDNDHADAARINVVFDQNNLVADNFAQVGGGGIYCRNATLSMVRPNTVVYNNVAGTEFNDAPGGGLRLINCVATIATRHPLLGTVTANRAGGGGGGISITGERARLDLYTTVPDRPTLINGNTADGVGGGIDIGSSATVHGYDIVVEGNTAHQGGGGIAQFDNDGGFTDRSRLLLQGTPHGAPAGALNCAPGLDCNRVSGNVARNAAGVDQGGAAIRLLGVAEDGIGGVSGVAETRLFGTRLDHNAGRSLLHLVDGNAHAVLDGVLIDGNEASADLLLNDEFGQLHLFHSTIAGNVLSGAVIRTDPSFRLQRSLVWQPAHPLIQLASTPLASGWVTHLVANDLSGPPADPTNRLATQSEVAFVDIAAGDYRLQAGSVALDYAPATTGATRDDFARSVAIDEAPDQFGPQDVGAYEKQAADGYNAAPTIEVSGTLTTTEDVGGETFLQGFSLADPDGDIVGALYVTTPPASTGFLDALYFAGVSATQLAPHRVVIEGPLSRITQDTATFAGVTRFLPARDFFGTVPIALELSDQGHDGIGGVRTAQATLQLEVLPVNDPPTLQVADIRRTVADLGMRTVELESLATFHPGPPNESGQLVLAWTELQLLGDPQGVLAAAPTMNPDGRMKYSLSGSAGVATLSVRIVDNGGTELGGVDRSAPATFRLRVDADVDALFADGFETSF